MKISDLKEQLKVHIPPLAEEIFNSEGFDCKDTTLLDEALFRNVSRKFNVLKDKEEEAIKKALKIKEDEAALAFFNLSVAYLNLVDGDVEKNLALNVPDSKDGEDALDMLPMAILLTQLEKAYNRYLALGMSEEDALFHMEAFGNCFDRASELMARCGLNRMYFNWLCIYLGACLVTVSGFNFEMKKNPVNGIFLKNKKSGEIVSLYIKQKFHKSGNVFMSAGFSDEEGSFEVELIETEEEYIGCPIGKNGLCENTSKSYKKADWEKILSPGDYAISFHIPKNADLSPGNLDKVFADGIEKIKSYYKDKNVRCIICGSWLLSPELWEILPEKSNIVAFGKRFTLIPVKCGGRDVFSFVFPPGIKDYNDLPENTSLERGLKKHYLEGKFVHTFYGAFEI